MKPHQNRSVRAQLKAELELCDAFAGLRSKDDILLFLKDLCSPAELQALVDRWQVVRMLNKDLSYRKISDITGVSVTTVGRVGRYLLAGHGGYTRALENNDYEN